MKHLLVSLRKRLNRLVKSPRIARYQGVRFVLDPRDSLDIKIMSGSKFEGALIKTAIEIIRREGIGSIIDVGANFGLYTVILGKQPCVRVVHACEPVHRIFNQLCANVFINELDKKVVLHNVALGATDGEATMYLYPGNSPLSAFDPGDDARRKLFSARERVLVKRGDSILDLRNEKIYLKIDVEGALAEVLDGCTNLLRQNTGFIQAEIGDEAQGADFIKLLSGIGWKLIRRTPIDGLFQKQ
jgi:FkbM family methyltransferase